MNAVKMTVQGFKTVYLREDAGGGYLALGFRPDGKAFYARRPGASEALNKLSTYAECECTPVKSCPKHQNDLTFKDVFA